MTGASGRVYRAAEPLIRRFPSPALEFISVRERFSLLGLDSFQKKERSSRRLALVLMVVLGVFLSGGPL